MDDLFEQNKKLKESEDALIGSGVILPDEEFSPLPIKRDPFVAPGISQPKPIELQTPTPSIQNSSFNKFQPAPDIAPSEPLKPYTELDEYKNILSRLDNFNLADNSKELTQVQKNRDKDVGLSLMLQGMDSVAAGMANKYGANVKTDESFYKALRTQADQQVQDAKDRFKESADKKREERALLLQKIDLLKEGYQQGRIARNDSIEQQKILRDQVRQNKQDEQSFKEDAYKLESLKNKVTTDKIDTRKKMDENDPNSAISQYAKMQAEQQLAVNRQTQKAMGIPVSSEQISLPKNVTAAQLKEMGLYKGEGTDSLRLMSILQRQQDLELKGKAEERRTQGQEFSQAQKDELSDKQLKDITSQDNAINFINDIRSFKEQNKIDVGQLADKRNLAAQAVNMDDPKVSTFRAMVGQQLAEYVKSISGSAVSDQERAILAKLIPKMDDSNETFNAKLDQLQGKLGKFKDRELDLVSKAQGKDVSKLKQSEASQSDRVRVQLPDGRLGLIPRENLQKALEKGAKEIK